MKINKLLAIAVLGLVAVGTARAQMTSSPYSRYGYGLLNDNTTSTQRSLGGIGYAMNSGRQINVMNPASYAATDSLTFLFDMGVDFTNIWRSEGDLHESTCGGGLDYITMQFPVSKTVGASLGLLPFSSVGYAFGSDITNGSETREGSGGLNQFYGGVSWSPLKNFSMGANVGYLFGTVSNRAFAQLENGHVGMFEHKLEVRDYHLDFGVQYNININRRNRVTLGVVYSPKLTLHGNVSSVRYDAQVEAKPDTTLYSKLNGGYTLPQTIGAGVAYRWNNSLLAEVDFTYQDWSKAKFNEIEGLDPLKFDNRWKIAGGIEWRPDARGAYFKRINYRLGAYYNHDYLQVLNNNVREYGVSCGFGFPVPGLKTIVNLGLEYKHRQAAPTALIKENYFNITLGVNFNEMWFWRNKLR